MAVSLFSLPHSFFPSLPLSSRPAHQRWHLPPLTPPSNAPATRSPPSRNLTAPLVSPTATRLLRLPPPRSLRPPLPFPSPPPQPKPLPRLLVNVGNAVGMKMRWLPPSRASRSARPRFSVALLRLLHPPPLPRTPLNPQQQFRRSSLFRPRGGFTLLRCVSSPLSSS
jgi:hypothetical protein